MSDIPSTKKKMGRPTKLTPEMQGRIVDAIRAGNYLDTAAAYAGINRGTLHDWLKKGRGKNARKPFSAFVEAVDEAMAVAEVRFVAHIATAAQDPKHWTASAWMLERRHPDRWGRRERVEHTGKDGGPVEISAPAHVVETKLDELAERRSKREAV